MIDYVSEAWREALKAQGLDSFDALWTLEADWFEPPNYRRGGWSGVMRIELPGADGKAVGMFLKRQENHMRKALAHPFSGEPTFAAEMRNILAMRRVRVPSLEPVYYAQRKVGGKWRAILMTRELLGYRPLDAWVDDWCASGWAGVLDIRRQAIAECAAVLRRMHSAGFVHNAMHPKHVFMRLDDGDGVDARLIDLEKMRRRPGLHRRTLRDLDSLNRRSLHWSKSDRLRFLKAYLGGRRLDAAGQALWRRLVRSYVKKKGVEGRHGS